MDLTFKGFIAATSSSIPSTAPNGYGYLLGLRGVFTLQTFLWTFLSLFLPGAVKDSLDANLPSTPAWQSALRKSLSVLVWNPTLLPAAFVLLSARTVALPFLHDPTRTVAASSLFRRSLRLWPPAAAAVLLAHTLTATGALGDPPLARFLAATGLRTPHPPYHLPTPLAVVNAAFALAWVNKSFAAQAGARAFPSGTLWILSLLYQQSYTVYMAMVVAPYTRPAWRARFGAVFILSAWWVQSWAWYSVSGLLLADAVVSMRLRERLRAGFAGQYRVPGGKRPRTWRCPGWVVPALALAVGWMMQFVWAAAAPGEAQGEIEAHSGLYNEGDLNEGWNPREPQARVDDYLVLMGMLLLVERFERLRWMLDNRVLTYLGRRSLSFFIAQALILYTAGVRLFLRLNVDSDWSVEAAVAVVLVVSVPVVVVGTELFYRLIDVPSQMLARSAFDWIRK